mmetsp:Transcript_644/g.1332  ORF Transcript_644/g.1332 Transcript_644/m.1332 type:complete len:80 (+) Transcript_644:202-441(+)
MDRVHEIGNWSKMVWGCGAARYDFLVMRTRNQENSMGTKLLKFEFLTGWRRKLRSLFSLVSMTGNTQGNVFDGYEARLV